MKDIHIDASVMALSDVYNYRIHSHMAVLINRV